MALEGKFDFIRKTNPWGDGKDKMVEVDETLTPDQVAQKLRAFALGMQGVKPNPSRIRGKKEGVILPKGMTMPAIPASPKGK